MSDLLRLIEDVDEARRTVLRRSGMLGEEGLPDSVRSGIRRLFGEDLSPDEGVKRILADVRARGDSAIHEWSVRIDGAEYAQVPHEMLSAALEGLDPELVQALRLAAGRVREFHEKQPVPSWTTDSMGGTLGQRVTPLRCVGIYVPGGTAPLPSSLLMTVIPAKVAGVEQVIVCTPPGRDGRVPDVILAAAHVAGADAVFAVGGAQAIAAMAFGTETMPRVDKIVGAGGLFVTLAKRQVYGIVGLDGLAGPTETVIVADDSANPAWVAADLLAQAEHDVLATAILLTPSRALAVAVQREVEVQTAGLSRCATAAQSLAARGAVVLTPDLDAAVRLADEFAPEHLCLSVRDPEAWAPQVTRAGGLFLGEHSFEVLGDYVAGPSHVMPTMGTARFASPVNVLDFCRITSIIALDPDTAARLGRAAACLARAESLTAHAAAAEQRGRT